MALSPAAHKYNIKGGQLGGGAGFTEESEPERGLSPTLTLSLPFHSHSWGYHNSPSPLPLAQASLPGLQTWSTSSSSMNKEKGTHGFLAGSPLHALPVSFRAAPSPLKPTHPFSCLLLGLHSAPEPLAWFRPLLFLPCLSRILKVESFIHLDKTLLI